MRHFKITKKLWDRKLQKWVVTYTLNERPFEVVSDTLEHACNKAVHFAKIDLLLPGECHENLIKVEMATDAIEVTTVRIRVPRVEFNGVRPNNRPHHVLYS